MQLTGSAATIGRPMTKSRVAVKILQPSMHQVFVLALFRILQIIVVLFVHFRIRGRECGVNILGTCLVLGRFACLLVVEKGLLQRTILIQCAADEVGGVRQVHRLRSK